ncbi:MAG: carbohydrate ABC transporter permease [Eisenbergiella massiliensis]
MGYFMLIFLSGIERIPRDLYESARLDGADSWTQFWRITFPLIRNVFRTCVTLWTITSVNFFVWAKMFSSRANVETITPVYFLYNKVFGSANAGTVLDVGAGAAVGVLVAVLVLIIYIIMNKVLREEELEY